MAEANLAPVAQKHPDRQFFVCIGEAQPLRYAGGTLAEIEAAGTDGAPTVHQVAVVMKEKGEAARSVLTPWS